MERIQGGRDQAHLGAAGAQLEAGRGPLGGARRTGQPSGLCEPKGEFTFYSECDGGP